MASFYKYKKKGSIKDFWEFRIRYKDGNKYKEKSKKGFETKKEAEHAARKIEGQLANGVSLNNENILIEDYLIEWLEVYKKDNVSKRSYDAYEKNIRLYLIPEFGSIKLKDLKRVYYQKFINNLLDKYALKTVKLIHTTMVGAINTAVNELDLLSKNPIQRIKLIDRKIVQQSETDLKCYDIDELGDFLKFASKEKLGFKYCPLFTFLARTGLRIGECLALQWEDIDFNNKTVQINKTLTSASKKQKKMFGPPKNASSNRVITLDSSVIQLLKKVKIEQAKNILKNGRYYKDLNFVFTHEDNSIIIPRATTKYLKELCEKGKFRYITMHGFRHTHAVHLLQSGSDIKYVSKRLGHATVDMTANVYLHVTKSIEENSINRYEEFMKNCGHFVGNK